ncbi:MAG TPA: diacylglycerol kinase family protein [Thermohalobaculum sp.]|nr:diacylglycerol kinase family protein [Thermohalobaculum sp.]
MSRIALVRNRASTRNLRSGVEAVPPEVRLIEARALDALTGELRAAHAAGAEIIAVDGGDGTVREVLSRVPEIWGDPLPRIAIIPHGNTNLIAREVGALETAADLAEVERRLEAGQPLTERRHAMLRLDYPAGERPPVRGSILGWGIYATATRMARDEISARGSAQVALAVFGMLTRVLVGGEQGPLRQGVAASLTVDGRRRAAGRRFVGVATSLQGPLAARMNPFWGKGNGPIRWLDILSPAARLAQAAPFLLRGRPALWMPRAGYGSGRASRIELELDSPFVMDGEVYAPPASGPLTLTADERITFISL